MLIELGLSRSKVQVKIDGEASHDFDLSDLTLKEPDLERLWDHPEEYGGALFRALFREQRGRTLLSELPPGEGLDLHLADPILDSVPWEFLHDGRDFLACARGVARCATLQAAPDDPGPARRARVLFISSDPLLRNGAIPPYALNLEEDWSEFCAALEAADPPCDLIRVRPPTFADFQAALAGMAQGIVHFSGHGGQDERSGYEAVLLFETRGGVDDPLRAGEFAAALRGHAGLAVISACRSASGGPGERANLARLLSTQSARLVLGMQMALPDETARRFTTQFYRFLFAGEDAAEAARQARLLLSRETPFLAGAAVLYRAAPGCGYRLPPGRGRTIAVAPEPDLSGLGEARVGFVGRRRELAQIGSLFAGRTREGQGWKPLTVNLHGPGGIGKTALMAQAARRFAPLFRAVYALRCEPFFPSAAQFYAALEAALGMPTNTILDGAERAREIEKALDGRGALLLLDNFETLAYAQRGDDPEMRAVARAAHGLLSRLPARGTTLLVSSRERTHLPREQPVEVPGLDDAPGSELFERALEQRRDEFDPFAAGEITRRVGGHPLAILLLARLFDKGQTRTLADFAIEALHHLPEAADEWNENERHATLAACFAYSLHPLELDNPELLRALQRLCLFEGRFTGQTAAEVVVVDVVGDAGEDDERQTRSTAALRNLHSRGLLECERVRFLDEEDLELYGMHPALRPFAAGRLTEGEKKAVLEAIYTAMDQVARLAWPGQNSGGIWSSPRLARTARAALLDLQRASGWRHDSAGADLRRRAGFLLNFFGDPQGAMGLYEQSLAIKESLGDKQGKSATLHEMAYILRVSGDLAGAMGLYEQSLAIQESLGDKQGKSATLHAMAYILRVRGDLAGAMGLYEQSLAIQESLGDKQGKAATLHAMANIYVTRGDLAGAMGLYEQSLEIQESLGDKKGKSATLAMRAHIYAQLSDDKAALRDLLEAFQILNQIGAELDARTVMDIILWLRDKVGLERFTALWQELTGQPPPPEYLTGSPSREKD
jgi:tetratricopeptide (TPR) repeat protein